MIMKLETSFQAVAIEELVSFFLDKLPDRATATELLAMAQSERLWSGGHKLFQRIRGKTLEAGNASRRLFQMRRNHFLLLECQYLFEEVCAKSLYNLSGAEAPFDEDSPDWIVPNAITLARRLGIEEKDILNLLVAKGS